MNKYIILILFLFSSESFASMSDTITKDTSYFRSNALLISSYSGRSLFLGTIPCLGDFRKSGSSEFRFKDNLGGYLEVDKFIHLYGTYVSSNLFYHELVSAGINRDKALILGGAMGFTLFLPKEFFDGFCEDGGFSITDLTFNAIGPLFFTGQEFLFGKQLIRIKTSFSKSLYSEQANGYLGNNFFERYFKDYNGHSYWFSFNAKLLFPGSKLPEWISIAAGYSANGMFGENENIQIYDGIIIPETQRYRQYLLSMDIDWSKINLKSRFLKALFYGFNFIKIPFPTMEINSNGSFKAYWLYF